MRLYDSEKAPNPRRVRIFLSEKGLTLPCVRIDLAAFEQRSDSFSHLNPWQTTPALELDDGTVITESMAICRYIEDSHPDPVLFGRTALEKAQIEMWNRRVELGLFAAVTHIFRHLHPGMVRHEVPQVAPWGEANKEKLFKTLTLINDRLLHSRHIAGDAFTVADITLLCAVDFMKPTKLRIPETHEGLLRWHQAVSARASAQA